MSEITCPECGQSFGGSVARLNLGKHRKKEHPESWQPSAAGKASARRHSAVVEVVSEMAEEAGKGRAKGAPTEDQLTRAFGRGLGMVSIAVASYAVETDPRQPMTPDQEEQLTDYLALSPEGARDLMAPIGRMFHRTSLNRRYGRQIVDNVDVVSSVAELATFALRWRRYFRERSIWEAQVRQGQMRLVAAEPPPFEAPVAPVENGATGAVSRQGVLVTPEMLAQMRTIG